MTIASFLAQFHHPSSQGSTNGIAHIWITTHPIWGGRGYNTYEWRGKPTDSVWIWNEGDLAQELAGLPWPLQAIEDGGLYTRYVRKDVYGGLWWRLVLLAYTVRAAARPFYVRCILTLHIWGLAYCRQGVVISWRDIGKKRPRI